MTFSFWRKALLKEAVLYSVALIGCGLMGKKRLLAMDNIARLVAVADIDLEKARELSLLAPSVQYFSDWKTALSIEAIDIVIVSTIHSELQPIAMAAIGAGKHVLIEKPAGISAEEINLLIDKQAQHKVCVQVGFNHRAHPALIKAKQLVDLGALGELYYIRANYGHGGRVDYDKEWRMDPHKSGGGHLVDQGAHLIDLSHWFLGTFDKISASLHKYYWDSSVEDNAFLTLETSKGQTAFLHTSLTEWRNRFTFEIVGSKGKLDCNGLGGSYGLEQLTFFQMKPDMLPPDIQSWQYPRADQSFELEFLCFLEKITQNDTSSQSLNDALQVMQVIEAAYAKRGLNEK